MPDIQASWKMQKNVLIAFVIDLYKQRKVDNFVQIFQKAGLMYNRTY